MYFQHRKADPAILVPGPLKDPRNLAPAYPSTCMQRKPKYRYPHPEAPTSGHYETPFSRIANGTLFILQLG